MLKQVTQVSYLKMYYHRHLFCQKALFPRATLLDVETLPHRCFCRLRAFVTISLMKMLLDIQP